MWVGDRNNSGAAREAATGPLGGGDGQGPTSGRRAREGTRVQFLLLQECSEVRSETRTRREP